MKRIIFIRDKLIEAEDSILSATDRLSSWHLGGSLDTSLAYDFFKPMGRKNIWRKMVCNSINLLKFSFIVCLAILGQLTMTDKLSFLKVDTTCKLCNQIEETFLWLLFCQ